jgi:hypothetical protein
MPVTNVQAVSFANNVLRPMADQYTQLYRDCKAVKLSWDTTLMGNLFVNGSGLVVDGSASDGRTPIVADDVQIFMQQVNALISMIEASAGAPLAGITKPAVRIK